MSARSIKQSENSTVSTWQQQVFAVYNGIRKRKIYYNVDFTEEEEEWIATIRNNLKRQKGVQINEDQTLLRFYYSADLNMEKCLEKLVEYNKWFTNPSIQYLTDSTHEIFKEGFNYSYGKALDGRPFIIMNVSVINTDKYNIEIYLQAVNHCLNRVIKEEFIPGFIEHYYYLLDLNEQLLSLPLSSLGEIIKVIGNAYSGCLERLMIINCTYISKWIYNRLHGVGVVSDQTANRISLYTKEQVQNGQLRKYIDQKVLEQKYGGIRQNIDHLRGYKNNKAVPAIDRVDQYTQTEYFSIEDEEYAKYAEGGTCCGEGESCSIY